ncbi:hypothetical protein ACKWTF_003069 [Chironomus riparius]
MSKRTADYSQSIQPSSSKRQKTFDPYKLIESLERLSIAPKHSHFASTTFSSNSNSSFSKVRNERDNNFIKWNQVSEGPNLLDLNFALESLKFNLMKLHCCKPEDVDNNKLFSIASTVLKRLKFKIYCGRFTYVEDFVKSDFSYKQAQMFAEQYYINLDMKKSNNFITSRTVLLLDDKPICDGEKYIQARQIIECISQIASESKQFSEMMLTEKLDLDVSLTLPSTSEQQTMVDLICLITTSIIKDNRYIAMNFGLVVAVTHLLQSLTSHFDKYSNIKDIDIGLENMFTLVLQLATFDVEIMLSLSESFVNITHKDSNRMTLFKSMCISYPFTNLEYSWTFRLMRMDLCPGCKFQIFFILLNHVFRFYDVEKIIDDRLDALIRITQNMNYLVFIFLANDVDVKFLVPNKGYSRKVEDACFCYRFLLLGTLILNVMLFKNQNSNPRHYQTIISLRQDSLIILNGLLNYSYDSPDFWKSPPHLMMNEIFVAINFDDLYFLNDSKTRIYPDKRKIFEMFIVKNPRKLQANLNPFKLFLKKFDPKNARLFEMKLDDDDSNINRRSVKRLKHPAIKMSREDLLKEFADDFKADESVMFSVEHLKKDKK